MKKIFSVLLAIGFILGICGNVSAESFDSSVGAVDSTTDKEPKWEVIEQHPVEEGDMEDVDASFDLTPEGSPEVTPDDATRPGSVF